MGLKPYYNADVPPVAVPQCLSCDFSRLQVTALLRQLNGPSKDQSGFWRHSLVRGGFRVARADFIVASKSPLPNLTSQ